MSYELTGKIANFSIDYKTKKATVTLELNEKKTAMMMYDNLNLVDKLAIKVDKYREKRSLDANSYAWLVIGKIADCVGASKDEIYLEMLKRYGQTYVTKVKHEEVELFKCANKYYEEHEKLESEEKAQYFRVWVGSSHYDTLQMSRFIDGIVSEAEDLDIPTKTPNQIAEMVSLWESEQ